MRALCILLCMADTRCYACFSVQAAQMFANLSPEQAQSYANMARDMHSSGATPAPGAAAASASTAPVSTGGMHDPKVAAEMMSNMSTEQLENMTRAAEQSGMLPAGMQVSPEQLKAHSPKVSAFCESQETLRSAGRWDAIELTE